MKFIFGIWTALVALSVSAVAAYYSIIGLTAIFAAAVIPVIIMGSVLELAKITTAIWLHSFWHQAPHLMKIYFTSATVILMFITSMGIFGFLSKAHIEQSANSSNLIAEIGRLDQDIEQEQNRIIRSQETISSFDDRVQDADRNIQQRIQLQQEQIRNIEERLQRDIEIQNAIIRQETQQTRILKDNLSEVQEQQNRLSKLRSNNDVTALQRLVGATVDGVMGPNTEQRIDNFESNLESRQAEISRRLEEISQTQNPEVEQARERISELQSQANQEISKAQEAINSFRDQLVIATTQDNSQSIAEQQDIIDQSRRDIAEKQDQKFELQSKLREIEVEVGPVKYIAELVYGQASPDLLEQAVRWVIITLVFVFDPLAIVLILAGISIIRDYEVYNQPNNDNKTDSVDNDVDVDNREDGDGDDNIDIDAVNHEDYSTPPSPQNNFLKIKKI